MKNRRLTFFILAFSSFAIFGGFAASAFAQDAIQCTPNDVNLTKNLRFPNDKNIYLGLGKLNFSSADNNLFAANSSGNLLFRNDAAQVITQSNTILLKNAAGDRIAGAYDTNPGIALQAANRDHYLIVDGKIEGWKVNGLNELCVRGSCRTSWPVDTDTQDLSISADGTVLSLTNGGSVTLTGGGGGGGITEIQDGDGAGGISVVNGTGPIVSLSAVGGSTGVSKIIAGSGISITSAPINDGTGEVTINMSGSNPCVAGFIRSGNTCLAGGLNGNKNVDGMRLIRAVNRTNSDHPNTATNDQVDFNAASGGTFATLDIQELNGTNAKFAMIRAFCSEAYIYVRSVGSGLPAIATWNLTWLEIRGSTLVCAVGNNDTDWHSYNDIFYVELDANKDIQWSLYASNAPTLIAMLYLVGYID